MMRKTICRTMATSTINAFTLEMVDGKPTVKNLPTITVMGKATEKDALKALREIHGKNKSITVGSIEVTEDTYEISVDDFIKCATKIEKGSEGSEKVSEGSEKEKTTI